MLFLRYKSGGGVVYLFLNLYNLHRLYSASEEPEDVIKIKEDVKDELKMQGHEVFLDR
jgi:hypothetical protein